MMKLKNEEKLNRPAVLTHRYPGVSCGDVISFGGSQNWFKGNLRSCGCGVVAAADTLRYLLGGAKPASQEQYDAYIKKLSRSFPVIPHYGMPGIAMALSLNLNMIRKKMNYRAAWAELPWKIEETSRKMLENDIPVPFLVGPDFHMPFSKREMGIKLYEQKESAGDGGRSGTVSYVWTKNIKDHFMVMTGLDGDWAEVSSWGERYYIDLKEYETYAKRNGFGLFSNIVRIRNVRK
ncbi:MAG: hypothetical protein Q4E57_03625 [Eubacteriales bacterium]|nr:hypothetical protein [Eubacteriales bacterium]